MRRGAVGLDVGTTAVRAAQVATRRARAVLQRIEEVPLPLGAVVDGRVAEPDAVAEALRLLWRRGRFSSRQIRLGVANPWVVVQTVDLPVLEPHELRPALAEHLADQLPVPVAEMELDCLPLGEWAAAGGRRGLRALAVAADSGMIADLLDAVRLARLLPVGVDLIPMALLRALRAGEPGDVVLDVGAHGTSLVVHGDGLPAYVRLLPIGGDQVTRALVERLGLAPEVAEAAKHALARSLSRPGTRMSRAAATAWRRGLATAGWSRPAPAPAPPSRVAEPPGRWAGMPAAASAEEVDRVVDETTIRLVEHVRAVLDDYRASGDAVGVGRLVLTGGASRCGRLARWLQVATELPVEPARPLHPLGLGRRLRTRLDRLCDLEAVAAVPVGLALGGQR
jgi:type IV pilus assembly protein PilM